MGVVRRYRTLTWLRDRLVKHKPSHDTNAYLLTGLYQLLYMNELEAYAAVDETVEASKSSLGKKSSAFLNAVFRNFLREQSRLESELMGQPLGIQLSCPDLLVERWTSLPCSADEICRWNNRVPHTVLHVCTSRVSTEAYRTLLRQEGIEAHPHPHAPHTCLVLPHGVRVDTLPGFREGHFFIQDPSAAEAVKLLAPRPGETVIDACAAPGGKVMLMAEAMQGQGRIVATDLHTDRMARLKENIRRMGWTNVSVAQADARDASSLIAAAGGEPVEAILLDVPCTNTGVIRRRPDARWRFTAKRLREHEAIQEKMLSAAVQCLKPGGRMVYSTCSIEPEECEGLIRKWISTHPEVQLVEERRLYPAQRGTDGSYAALLILGGRCTPEGQAPACPQATETLPLP